MLLADMFPPLTGPRLPTFICLFWPPSKKCIFCCLGSGSGWLKSFAGQMCATWIWLIWFVINHFATVSQGFSLFFLARRNHIYHNACINRGREDKRVGLRIYIMMSECLLILGDQRISVPSIHQFPILIYSVKSMIVQISIVNDVSPPNHHIQIKENPNTPHYRLLRFVSCFCATRKLESLFEI